ncbi:MAG: glutamate--tRNA ligase [Candidatus Micrarchaeota archaeon]
MGIEETIRKHALKNAFDYGKAQAGGVVGKVIAEHPEAKGNMKEVMAKISQIVGEVNSLAREQIEKELEKFEFVKKEEKEKVLELPNAQKGKVITRFPPEPSGYPHIGHAKALFLDVEAARVYEGKFYLRWDDTNPEKEKKEFVGAIKEGMKWLGIKWDKEEYASDYMPKLYYYAEELIKKEGAYICKCPQEEMKKNRASGEECACRARDVDENLSEWEKMKESTKPGDAILRFKGDMKALNTVMRDPTLFRVLEAEHYRQGKKYRVWPVYDFQGPILDSITGITHIMRSKEYELRDEFNIALLRVIGLRVPEIVEFSRLSIKNAPISKRHLRPLIEEKKVESWSDPRLPTLDGLKRRGILPEAIKKFVLQFGLSKTESEPSWEALLNENSKILEPISERYFFVANPVELSVKGAGKGKAKLKKHPSKEMGERIVAYADSFYISGKDAEAIKEGETFRLKELFNVKLAKKGEKLEAEFAGKEIVEGKKIQWVSALKEEKVECEVLVPRDLLKENGEYNEDSLRIEKGLCEKGCAKLKVGSIIQFERYGFCRLDEKKKEKLVFVLSCD